MDRDKVIERFGELTKEEPISTLGADIVMTDTMVFEAVSPFFGYYHDAPLADKEPYVYIALEQCYPLSQILRAVIHVRKRLTHPLIADPGNIYIGSEVIPVIRVKGIEKFCRLRHLQQYFLEEGLQPKKNLKPTDNQMAMIRLQKFLRLRDLGDGLYLDDDDDSKGYFVIQKELDWGSFKSLTKEAKYDTSILYFDAAQATLFENNHIIDLVRVYRERLAKEKLAAIRDRYQVILSGTAL